MGGVLQAFRRLFEYRYIHLPEGRKKSQRELSCSGLRIASFRLDQVQSLC